MEAHLEQWLSLLVRWLHLIAGIAWIGSSFYFNWLDGNLRAPENQKKGVLGELWSVHGGGFYVVEKYKVAPDALPKTLHWFKWESYTTWITGFSLLVLVYYLGGAAYMVDPNKAALPLSAAIAIGVGTLVLGWFGYDLLARTRLVDNSALFAALGFALATAIAYGLSRILPNRAAYIHVGAMLGTIMTANVFFVIIPSQKDIVTAMQEGREPNALKGMRAKQRSLHNNYITLPVLFIMVSNHYPNTFEHRYNWLVLAVLAVIGATVRHWFNLKNKGIHNRWIWPATVVATIALAVLTAPRSISASGNASFAEVQIIIKKRCTSCHSATPTDDIFVVAPNGVAFDTPAQIKAMAQKIDERTIKTPSMPFANKTQMTDQERQVLGQWIAAGAKID